MSQITRRQILAATPLLAAPAIARAAGPLEIQFFFPIAVAGPITKIIDGYAAAFAAENPDIRIKPVYAGSYDDTIAKALTALRSGNAPPLAMLGAIQVYTLIDQDAIVPFDELLTSAEDKAWMGGFFPAFMANGNVKGHVWSIPFQRSTAVLYWNKNAFQEAGLNPETPPANWDEQMAFGHKLVKRSGSTTSRWGLQIPATGGTYWLYQGLATEAGTMLANADGTRTAFNDKGAVDALQYWVDLAKQGVSPPGVIDWGTTPTDFVEGRAAMIWTTTGNLTFIRDRAKFPFGVAQLPAKLRRGSPTGGANFHIFKSATAAQRAASLRFVKWVTAPERCAAWSIATGYVATRPDAWDTKTMKDYTAGFPAAAVARDQLPVAVPELSTHENQRVTIPLNSALQAALSGSKQAKPALDEAQANADRVLKRFQHA
ncbi:MAG: ABC transporter substrate-binding protein [Rhodospirillales bacterium]|nr:ABC transporter substrate-binding protein [Rhodospirillales bacterium]MDE2200195.1 ABC transporter substrate-binding protein [Rhodospirillales bacterium]MDE2576703.1 ABC transporter substrate-binding protein [Rhodospirillales bacterium]